MMIIIIMKINFIRHISDDILKENHELRSYIIIVKQQLQNFEDNMIAFIRQSQVEIPIMATPHQTLSLFMKTVSSQLTDYQLQIKKYQVSNKILKQTADEVQLKNQQLKKQIANNGNRQSRWKQQLDCIQKKYYDLAKKYSQFQIRQQSFKKEIRSIYQRNIMEMNIQEQLKKKQIQGIKLACHHQFKELRDRVESENVDLEKKFKQEIEDKDKRIQQLEKLMQKLASQIKLDSSETTILTTVLSAFQQSHKSKKIIEQLKQQNLTSRKTINGLQTEKIQLQSKLMEKNIQLLNLQSQLEKLRFEKLQFEKNLGTKIKEMQKSEKDMRAMQLYYENKWNSDYKKVKTQLQKAFLQKSQELQKVFTLRMQQFQTKMIEWVQRIKIYEHKNKELERIHNLDCTQKQDLRKEIQQLIIEKKSLERESQQNWKMSREEIIMIKLVKYQQDNLYKQQIKSLAQELQKRQNSMEAQASRIEAIIKDLNQKKQIQIKRQLENQQQVFLASKLDLKKSYQAKIKNLREQVYQFQKKIENVKQVIKKQSQQEIQITKQKHQKLIKEKEEQYQKKMQKNALKMRDYQNKLVSSKKQHEQIMQTMDKQRLVLQKQLENFKNKLKYTENQLKLGHLDKKQTLEINKQMEVKIENLQKLIETKNKEIYLMKNNEMQALTTAQKLTNLRNSWIDQLLDVQNTYKKQFTELKFKFDRQINFYKSKIWQLEKQYKNQPISQKNYERILSLHSEKEELKNALDIKEAQNIVLSQVNELYETQLNMNDIKISAKQLKAPKPMFKRKVDIHRKFTEVGNQTLRSSHNESSDMMKMKKYIKQSYKKQQYLSLAKTRYKQMTDFYRMKTTQI